MTLLTITFVLELLITSLPTASAPDDFGDRWYDGRAEVSGYQWRGERYGEERTGEAVAIFVTEPFGTLSHVKVDAPERAQEKVVTALKLNLVRDFQTGIYDYNTMTSVFVRADDLGLMKLTFSSAEWCGHVFEDVDRRGDTLTVTTRSYFQGESGERKLETRPSGLVGEELFIRLRGLHKDPLAAGASRTLPFLAGSFERRLRHSSAVWGNLKITRVQELASVTVPAGTFEAIAYELTASDGRTGVVHVEPTGAKRLLAWRWAKDGRVLDAGELTGTQRMPYWQLHAEGQEELRARLGLTTTRAR